uniref:Ig-like domain-containing protein n=1 Tax=Anabas testudineus TaxID=64144 RepID=A0A7N6AY06_ANATE
MNCTSRLLSSAVMFSLLSLTLIVNDCVYLCFSCCFLSSLVPVNITAKPGQNVTLPCKSATETVSNAMWMRPKQKPYDYVFFYRGGRPYDKYHHPQFQDRVNITEINDESLTVTLHNVSVTDSGTYECHVTVEGTGRNKRGLFEVKGVIKLTVSPKGEFVDFNMCVKKNKSNYCLHLHLPSVHSW